MNTHHSPVILMRRSLTTLLAALLALAYVLPAMAQPKPAPPAGAPSQAPVVRYIGMTTGVVGEPFVLRARVRDAVTGAPLAGAPVIFTLGDARFEAVADAAGVAEQVTPLTPALAGATVTARYGAEMSAQNGLLALATTDGGDAVSTANVTAAALTPANLVATLAPGQSVVENKLATLPAAAQAAGDIVFAFDTTASMGFTLPATQGLAEDIMAALTADGLDVRFGATAFQDYAGVFPTAFGYPATAYGPAGSYPHVRVQPLTADTAAVANAIYALQAASSDDPGDPPGSYSRALYETVAELTPVGADPVAGALGYRPAARRMVALFGDDLPHDNDLNQGVPNSSGVYSTGGDPGRDGVLQEASNPAAIGVGNDDLDWQGVLATMQSNGVALLSYDLNPFTTDYWTTWAAATGGEHLFDYDGMVAALRGRLQSQSTAASVTLRASAGFENWVSVQPASYTNVALPASLPFSVTITPPMATAPGVYNFRVELLNGSRVEAWQNVAITVPGAANRAPTAVNDSFSVDEDSVANVLAVLANDSDVDGDSLTVTAVTQPANGVVTLVGGVVRYTPNANYNGSDSFTYTVSDGSLTATATVTLAVRPVNRAPLAVNDSFSVEENSTNNVLDVRANDSDPDNDALTIVAVGAASNGVVTHDGAVVRYTPNANYRGADSFTYTVSDGSLTATATVTISVQPAAGAPAVMLSLAIEGSGAASDGVITVGQAVTVVATITNTGQSTLAIVPLRLAVAPAVLELIGASLPPDSANGGMHVWEDVTGVGTLAPGARIEVRMSFRSVGPSRDLPGQVMTAAGVVQGATDTAGQTAPPANAVVQVRVTAPQVAIATRMIDPAGGELKANQVLTMSVRITNTGDTLITTLPLRDRFDGSVLTFVRASVSGGKVTGSGAAAQVAWTDLTTALGDLAPGQSVEVLIAYRVKVVFWSSLRQSVVEGARDEYGDLLPTATAGTTIYCMKLELTMTSQPPAGSRVPRNAEIEYTLRLRTPGLAPLTNLILRGALTGDGAFYVEDEAGGVATALDHQTTCPVRAIAPSSDTQQTWVMDRLDAGASCTIAFKVKVAAVRKAGYVAVSVEGMAAELLTPVTVKVRHSVTTQLQADIAAFAAASRATEIEVFWEALSEEDVTGYHVWRSAHNELSIAERVTLQPIAPDGGAQSFYTIVDALPDGAEEAYYWLEVLRNDESEFVGPVWAAPQAQAMLYLPITMNAHQ